MRDFHFRLPDSLYEQMNSRASELGRPMSSLCREALALYLDRLEQEASALRQTSPRASRWTFEPVEGSSLEDEWGDLGLGEESRRAWERGFQEDAWDSGYHHRPPYHVSSGPHASDLLFGSETYSPPRSSPSHFGCGPGKRWLDELWA